jgi:superfamily II DNA or RNA helicase
MAAIVLRDYQDVAVTDIRAAFKSKLQPVLFQMPTGAGKCLGRGTPVLLYDGTVKPVENIVVGDLLIGPDSKARTVQSLARGRENLYRVTPVKGDPYIVNESHILSLKISGGSPVTAGDGLMYGGDEVCNISVLDYLKSSKTFKHVAKGWRTGIEFQPRDVHEHLPPYMLGLWLGDGTNKFPHISTADFEVVDAICEYAISHKMRVETEFTKSCPTYRIVSYPEDGRGRGNHPNRMANALDFYHLRGNKHVPDDYKCNSREVRLEILAGIVDTDGYLSNGTYDLIFKERRLADDVAYLARSLGLSSYVMQCEKGIKSTGFSGTYYRLNINGDVDIIPCRVARRIASPRQQKKSVLVTGINVEPIGEGDYYGFEIDGDHLFMLGDFTVTHNTYTFSYIAANASAKGNSTIIIVHRNELLMQASRALHNLGIQHGMISPHFTPNPHHKIQVASVDTLLIRLKKTPGKFKFDLVVFDEAHHVTKNNKWGKVFALLAAKNTLGVTATPARGDGIGMGVDHGGIFKSLVTGPPVSLLIERGMLINPVVYAGKVIPDFSKLKPNKDGELNVDEVAALVDKRVITGDAVEHYTAICPGVRAVVFCARIDHAEHVVEQFCQAGYKFKLLVGAPRMKEAERDQVVREITSGVIQGICVVDLVSEGFDVPALKCCIMLRHVGTLTMFLQMIGRIMRPDGTDSPAFALDHVGNVGTILEGKFVPKHGLPCTDREWTLEGRKKGKKKQATNEIKLSQCPNCYYVFEPEPCCPACGHEMPVAGRKEAEVVDGTLGQITDDMVKLAQISRRREIAQARTLEQLQAYAAQKGYSSGWAWHTFNSRKQRA